MADWLLLRLPRAAGEPASWLIADARGAPAGPAQGGPWTLAAARAPGRRVCALVPGADVLLAEPEIPVKAGAKLQQLVPYALEEQLADDIDDLHFAIGKRAGDSARAPVAVVARALLPARALPLRPARAHCSMSGWRPCARAASSSRRSTPTASCCRTIPARRWFCWKRTRWWYARPAPAR